MNKLSLAERDLFIFNGVYNQPVTTNINQVFECRQPVLTLILVDEEDFEYCEVLELMYGYKPNIQTLWDWHDVFWDRLHDRTGQTLDSLFQDIVSCRYDLPHLAEKSYLIESIMRKEMERRKHRHQPQNIFIPPLDWKRN